MTEKIGIIGLGIIGSVWANHHYTDGRLAATWNRTSKEDFPRWVASVSEVAEKADLIHVCLSDEISVRDTIESLLPHLSGRHTVVQSTTIDPNTSDYVRERVIGTGAKYFEAPFTGSLPAARERKVVFFLGCSDAEVEVARSYLQSISQLQFHIGDHRQACTIKLAMNMQIASAMEALAESLSVCRDVGIDDKTFFAVFQKNASYSGVAALKEPKILAADFTPQFSVKHLEKDLRLLQENQKRHLPLLNVLRTRLQQAEDQGLQDLDFSVIVQVAS